MLPTRRDGRGSATDRHGFVISSNTDGAMYVKPYNNNATAIKIKKMSKRSHVNKRIHNKLLFGHKNAINSFSHAGMESPSSLHSLDNKNRFTTGPPTHNVGGPD